MQAEEPLSGDHDAWLAANTEVGAGELHAGMEVLSSDGERIGRVKTVRVHDFLVDRPAARDLYVPLTAIRQVALEHQRLTFGPQVELTMTSREVEEAGWSSPPL